MAVRRSNGEGLFSVERFVVFGESTWLERHPENVNPLVKSAVYRRCLITGNGLAVRIVGGSGSGKSHFLKLLRKLLPNVETDEATLVRLVLSRYLIIEPRSN